MSIFQDKQVIVTGGTGALGAAVVRRLLEEGADCHVTCQSRQELDGLSWADQVTVHVGDLGDEETVRGIYGHLDRLFGSIHVAGGFAMGDIQDTSLDQFDHMMTMNARTCFLCCREAVIAMRAAGGVGRIVNVGARPVLQPAGGMISYTTSKAAVASITQCLAAELHGEDILVNAVLPSIMDTPSNRKAMPDADFDAWPKLDDVATTICFLAGPNMLTSGALVPVYGRS